MNYLGNSYIPFLKNNGYTTYIRLLDNGYVQSMTQYPNGELRTAKPKYIPWLHKGLSQLKK